jgi:hypothetical protein
MTNENKTEKQGQSAQGSESAVDGLVMPDDLSVEESKIFEALICARKIQTFLWGKHDGSHGLEQWRQMFIKRVWKIELIDDDNPHAMIELKKRLLQNAALSIALLAILNESAVLKEVEINSNPSEA